jgi:serine/threonine protein kinase
MIGSTVGKYRIVDKLGRGGMGTVYKAVDQTLDREVAIKVLNPGLTDADLLKRFRAEAITLARLNHPGIATIYELHHQQDDELLMVMEFVRGETFHDLSDRLGPLAPPQAAHLSMQVLDALGHAHRGGVVHRDLKPANLMITDAGAVKVMDFGIARVLGTEHFTLGGYMMGTPAYMAPEQVLGREIDGRADLYSVGVVLYRLLSGQLPFKADTAISMVQMQISEAPTPITAFKPDLPVWCSAIVERALAKSPADRFQSAEEFRAALSAAVTPQALGEMPTLSTPTPPGLPVDLEVTVPHRTPTQMRASSTVPSSQVKPVTSPIAAVRPAVPSAPTPTNTPPVEKTTTVVLGRTHLIAIAALLVIVATGIAVLAFAAFRRSGAAPAQTAAPGVAAPASAAATPDTAAAGAPPPAGEAMPPSTVAPPSGASPPSPAPPVPSTAATALPATPRVTPAAGERGVATAGAGPASKTAARGATSGVSPGGSPTGGRGAVSRETVSAPAPTPPPAPAPPPVAAEPPVTFNQVRLLVAEGERVREREGMLQLGDGRVSIVTAGGGAPIMSVTTDALTGIFYARSKQPRWRDASGQTVESKIDLGRLGFLRSERNWVILLTSGEPVIFRIEDAALRTILPALQERTGHTIQR